MLALETAKRRGELLAMRWENVNCLGLLSLAKRYGNVRLEAACMLALQIGACQYRHVRHQPRHRLGAGRPDTLPPVDQACRYHSMWARWAEGMCANRGATTTGGG